MTTTTTTTTTTETPRWARIIGLCDYCCKPLPKDRAHPWEMLHGNCAARLGII